VSAPKHLALLGVGLSVLMGCEPISPVTRADPEPLRTRMEGPPNAKEDECWGRLTTPAIVETVTDQILLQPAEIGSDGTVRSQAVYKTETRQAIIREREDLWFETLCEEELTVEFVMSLQRALQARDIYSGRINGDLDPRTRRAIRAYQQPQGVDSAILTRAAARQLGLLAYGRQTLASNQ